MSKNVAVIFKLLPAHDYENSEEAATLALFFKSTVTNSLVYSLISNFEL